MSDVPAACEKKLNEIEKRKRSENLCTLPTKEQRKENSRRFIRDRARGLEERLGLGAKSVDNNCGVVPLIEVKAGLH